MTAAGIEDGRLLRSVSKSGKVNRETLSDWASGRSGTVIQADRDRALRRPRSPSYLREAVPEERWGSEADQVSLGAFIEPDHGTLSRVGAGYRNRGQRQPGTVVETPTPCGDFEGAQFCERIR